MTSILQVKNTKNPKLDYGKLIVRCEKLQDSNCKPLFTQSTFRCGGTR
jgi:hypothetical protein